MFLLQPLLLVYGFWLGFLMYAAVVNAGFSKLPLHLKALLLPPGLVFAATDLLFNATAGSLLFWSPPWKNSCYTLSQRMSWLIANDKTWRAKVAGFIVTNLLIPFTKDY